MVARHTLQGAVERPNRQWDQRPGHEDQTRQRRLRRPTDQDDGQRDSQDHRRDQIDEPRADGAFRPPTLVSCVAQYMYAAQAIASTVNSVQNAREIRIERVSTIVRAPMQARREHYR
jgi:hypothetical protein